MAGLPIAARFRELDWAGGSGTGQSPREGAAGVLDATTYEATMAAQEKNRRSGWSMALSEIEVADGRRPPLALVHWQRVGAVPGRAGSAVPGATRERVLY